MEFPDVKYRNVCSEATLQSKKEGFFKLFADRVIEAAGTKWLKDVFQKQSSDVDRIKSCFENQDIRTVIEQTLKNIQPVFRNKSAENARKARLEGDDKLKSCDLEKALLLYSQSVIRSPAKDEDKTIDDGLTLALAFKSRAHVSLLLNRYKDCLKDIHLSLEEGIPSSSKHQLYQMMATCYINLGQVDKAKVALKVAISFIEQQVGKTNGKTLHKGKKTKHKERTPSDDLRREKQMLEKQLNTQLEDSGVKLDMSSSTEALGTKPEVFGDKNEKYSAASNLVGFKSTREAGRFGVAADHIDTGTTLIVEEPYASCLLPDMFGSHCHNCFSRLYTPVPCRKCSGLAFCSVACRDTACNSYHKYECPYMGLFIGSGMSILAHLSLRILTQSGVRFFKQLNEKMKKMEQAEVPVPEMTSEEQSYINIYNLVTLNHLRPCEDMFRRCIMAIFLVRCLTKSGYFEGNTQEDDELLAGSLILRHLQVLQFNSHEIYETKVEPDRLIRTSKITYTGVGLYSCSALLNHECNPSVTRYFYGKQIVVTSSRPIEKGEVIAENYGPVFTKRNLEERTRELTSRYWFHCTCQACIEDWPTFQYLNNELLKLKCTTKNCKQIFPQPKSTKQSEMNPRCPRCLETINLEAILKRVTKLKTLFEKGMQYLDIGSFEKAQPLFTAYLDEIHQIASPPSKDIPLCQEALRTCLSQNGNKWIVNE